MGAAEVGRSAYSRGRELRDGDDLLAAARAFLEAADQFEVSREAELHAAALMEAGQCYVAAEQAPQATAPFRHAASVLRGLVPERGDKARRDLARALTNLGQALGDAGDPDAAFRAFEEALRLTRDEDEHLYAWTALSVGRLYRELKRPKEARGYLADAYEVFRRTGDDRQAAHAANNLGAVFNDLEDHEQALEQFRLARGCYVDQDDGHRVAITDLNIARQELELDRLEDAEKSIEAALVVLTRPEHSTSRAAALTTKSRLLWKRGHREEALTPLIEAAEIYQRSGQVSDYAAAIGTHGGRLMELGRFEQGLALLEVSMSGLERTHDTLRGPELRAFYLDRINEAYAALVGSYIVAGRDEAALAAAERAKARTLARLLAAVSDNRRGADRDELIAAQRELGAVHEALAHLTSDAPAKEFTRLERRERELELALRSLEAALGASLAEEPRKLVDPVVPGATTVPELLLEYMLAPAQSYLIARIGNVVEAHVLPGSGELEPAIRALRDDLRLGLAPPHAHSLYRTLLEPVQRLLDTVEQILIIPDGVLLDLPFSVLTSAELDRRPGLRAWSEHHWLVRTHAVRYAPSAGVAAALAARSAQRGRPDGGLAAFAAPLGDDHELAPTSADLPGDATRAADRAGVSLRPLPFAFEETATICRELGFPGELTPPVLFDSAGFTVRSHSAATKRAAVELAAHRAFRYWHFACHGLVDLELSDHSGLVLSADPPRSDSYWRAYEVASVSMPCELATLSACDTGRGRKLRGEGVFGLARAFLTAGADTVCVSLWPVVDRTAATLMADFYRALADGEDKPTALRRAQNAAVERGLHPRHWGAFTLIGAP